jgi:hypothetical protein
MLTQLESPGKRDRQQHTRGGYGQRRRNADARRDLSPQDAAERHASHEHDDKGNEPARTHPWRQRHLRRNLQRREYSPMDSSFRSIRALSM